MAKKRRSDFFRKRNPPGAPPGTLMTEGSHFPVIRLIAYDDTRVVEKTIDRVDEIKEFLGTYAVCWVDVDGFGDAGRLREVAGLFSLHPLALEDVVNTHQRAKVEGFPNALFFVAHILSMHDHQPRGEQVSMFLGKNFVLTFQENPGDCFTGVRERIRRNAANHAPQFGPDYLLYTLLDFIVDSSFPVLEHMGDELDAVEDSLLLAPTSDVIHKIHDMRRSLQWIRRQIWPLRDSLSMMMGVGSGDLIRPETQLFFRDCQDHTLQVIDILETYRERASNLTDVYLSSINNRMNEIMKVLTIIATIFIPLTFIVGVYGMNFDPARSPYNMPEIEWRYGYIYVWALMLSVTALMLSYFWRKGWFR